MRTALAAFAALTIAMAIQPCTAGPLPAGPFAQLVATRYTQRDGLPAAVPRIASTGGRIYAGTPDHYAIFDGSRWTAPAPGEAFPAPHAIPHADSLPAGAVVTSIARARRGYWAVTSQGPLRYEGKRWTRLDLPRSYKIKQPAPNIDTTIRQVVNDRAGNVWIASDQGVYGTDGADWWHPLTREDGMPYEDVLCVAQAPNGDLWGGTTAGAWRLRAGQWRYFWGKRWLPGNTVSAITFDSKGAVWLATNGGVARIEERKMTLPDKAAHYEEITAARHSRRGWVTSSGLRKPGDLSGGHRYDASDNDGLWTALYVAAEAFRYAVTKDPQAREMGKKSMNALLDLVRLSGVPGYPARAMIRKGEDVTGYDPEETVRVPGETDRIWFTSPLDPNLLVKGDTSSDELDGHYFAWYIYHDLAADATEKKAIRDACAAVTDNILKHNYRLVGHTGRMTRWGAFGPQFMNDDPRWQEERGLNSIELLCYLKVAAYITGEKRFSRAYDDLIARHHYLLNTLNYRRGQSWYAVNHSDDELAYCVYYPLLMLEKEPSHRAVLLQSLATTWNGGPITAGIREEASPFYSFIYGALTGGPCRAEEALGTLHDWPWELIDWKISNSHRHDVTRRTALGASQMIEIDRVLPASERRMMKWNGNPWQPDGGDDGQSEEDGAAWLLPYWMGRHHGIIGE